MLREVGSESRKLLARHDFHLHSASCDLRDWGMKTWVHEARQRLTGSVETAVVSWPLASKTRTFQVQEAM